MKLIFFSLAVKKLELFPMLSMRSNKTFRRKLKKSLEIVDDTTLVVGVL